MTTLITISLMSACWWRKNIIMMLLSMEMLLISVFTSLATSPLIPSTTLFMMLVLMASGSSFGLSLLVAISRSHKSSNASPVWNLTFDNHFHSHDIITIH